MMNFENYKWYLVYPKNSNCSICEVFAENAEDAIMECVKYYNDDGIYTVDNVYAVCRNSKKSLFEIVFG